MHRFDSLRCLFLRCETDEREAAGPARASIGGNVNVDDLPNLGKEVAKLRFGRVEVEIAYEYLV